MLPLATVMRISENAQLRVERMLRMSLLPYGLRYFSIDDMSRCLVKTHYDEWEASDCVGLNGWIDCTIIVHTKRNVLLLGGDPNAALNTPYFDYFQYPKVSLVASYLHELGPGSRSSFSTSAGHVHGSGCFY